MIRVMQLLSHVPLFNLQLPSNALAFFSVIIETSNFDFLPSAKIVGVLMTFKEVPED